MGLGILGLDAYGAAEIDDGGDIFSFLSEYSGARVVWFGLIRVQLDAASSGRLSRRRLRPA